MSERPLSSVRELLPNAADSDRFFGIAFIIRGEGTTVVAAAAASARFALRFSPGPLIIVGEVAAAVGELGGLEVTSNGVAGVKPSEIDFG